MLWSCSLRNITAREKGFFQNPESLLGNNTPSSCLLLLRLKRKREKNAPTAQRCGGCFRDGIVMRKVQILPSSLTSFSHLLLCWWVFPHPTSLTLFSVFFTFFPFSFSWFHCGWMKNKRHCHIIYENEDMWSIMLVALKIRNLDWAWTIEGCMFAVSHMVSGMSSRVPMEIRQKTWKMPCLSNNSCKLFAWFI